MTQCKGFCQNLRQQSQMINETFQILHLQQRKITTPLFRNAKEAFIGQAYGHKFHSKYLVVESNRHLDEKLFIEGNICPVFIYKNKSYIFQEGESLYTYFLSKKESDVVLCEQQIWKLLSQTSRALLLLRSAGFEHRHLKEYAIRRVNADTFKLMYHPTMVTVQELIKDGNYSCFQFYLSPQQLVDLSNQRENSCVFTLAAMVLNIMNPLDFRRDIYSRKEYAVNRLVLQEKITNASVIYSAKIMEIIRRMLRESYKQRITLQQLIHLVDQVNPFEKKLQMVTSIKSIVSSKLQRSKEKSNSPPYMKVKQAQRSRQKRKEHTPKVISFERGTFGGHREEEEQQRQPAEDKPMSREQEAQEIYSINMKKEKTLKKNQSDYPTLSAVKASQRSYSEYLNTMKKANKEPPESKQSQADTKAQSEHAKLNITIFTDYNNSEEEKSQQGYNQYMKRENVHKQTNSSLKEDIKLQPQIQRSRKQSEEIDSKRGDYIRVQALQNSSLRYSSASSRGVLFGAEEQTIQASMRSFEFRINQSRLKLGDCLEDPSFLAKRLGFQGVWINGNVYYGQFKNGRRNGFALELFENNQYYYGNYKDDMFHGEGFYFWNNHEHFLGLFEAGTKKEGTWCGKNKYVGEIKENKRHGIGTYIYSNGSMYEGEWFLGKRHGSGIIIEPSGEKFIGTFKMGKKWGHGAYLVNGCRISGVWDGQLAVGPCEIVYQDGRTYKGMINSDFQMHGEGELLFPTGSICKGQFMNDDFVFGEMVYRNGQHYIGHVKEMRRHGKGTYTYLGGNQITGQWRDNVFVSGAQ